MMVVARLHKSRQGGNREKRRYCMASSLTAVEHITVLL